MLYSRIRKLLIDNAPEIPDQECCENVAFQLGDLSMCGARANLNNGEIV